MMRRRPNENRAIVPHFRALSPVGSGLFGLRVVLPVGFLFLASSLLGSNVSVESEGEAAHWAFRPLTSSRVIEDEARGTGQSVVDYLIDAELEERGLGVNGPADKYTLIRRVRMI